MFSAFCSNECSKAFGWQMLSQLPGMLLEMPCGCLAVVHGVDGNGSTMPWLLCKQARGRENYLNHSNEIHREAVEIVKKKLEEES